MREWLSLVGWLVWFLSYELPAKDVLGYAPWYSLSSTVTRGVKWWWPIAVYVIAFMAVLAGHFIFDYTYRWVVLMGVIGVLLIASHLIGLRIGEAI